MTFISLLWSIIHGLFDMIFNWVSNNPFIYIVGLVVIALTSIYTFNLIFKRK